MFWVSCRICDVESPGVRKTVEPCGLTAWPAIWPPASRTLNSIAAPNRCQKNRSILPVTPARPSGSERSEEHTSELQSLMRISYAVFCLQKKTEKHNHTDNTQPHQQ